MIPKAEIKIKIRTLKQILKEVEEVHIIMLGYKTSERLYQEWRDELKQEIRLLEWVLKEPKNKTKN